MYICKGRKVSAHLLAKSKNYIRIAAADVSNSKVDPSLDMNPKKSHVLLHILSGRFR